VDFLDDKTELEQKFCICPHYSSFLTNFELIFYSFIVDGICTKKPCRNKYLQKKLKCRQKTVGINLSQCSRNNKEI
jgi:hypothetical protein